MFSTRRSRVTPIFICSSLQSVFSSFASVNSNCLFMLLTLFLELWLLPGIQCALIDRSRFSYVYSRHVYDPAFTNIYQHFALWCLIWMKLLSVCVSLLIDFLQDIEIPNRNTHQKCVLWSIIKIKLLVRGECRKGPRCLLRSCILSQSESEIIEIIRWKIKSNDQSLQTGTCKSKQTNNTAL